MKRLFLALCLLAAPGLAQELSPTEIIFTSTSQDRNYGLFVVAGQGDCPVTRYMILGEGVEAISQTLTPGESAILDLGHGFGLGEHSMTLTAVGCALPLAAARLVYLNQSSPGHGRAPDLQHIQDVSE